MHVQWGLKSGVTKLWIGNVRCEVIQMSGITGCTTPYDGIHLVAVTSIISSVVERVVVNIQNGTIMYDPWEKKY